MAQAQIDAMPLKDREHIRVLRRGAKSKRQQGKALWAEQKLKREHEAAAPSASLAGSAGAIASAVAGAAASNMAAANAVRAAAPPPIGAGAAAAAAAVARAVAPPPQVAPPESVDVRGRAPARRAGSSAPACTSVQEREERRGEGEGAQRSSAATERCEKRGLEEEKARRGAQQLAQVAERTSRGQQQEELTWKRAGNEKKRRVQIGSRLLGALGGAVAPLRGLPVLEEPDVPVPRRRRSAASLFPNCALPFLPRPRADCFFLPLLPSESVLIICFRFFFLHFLFLSSQAMCSCFLASAQSTAGTCAGRGGRGSASARGTSAAAGRPCSPASTSQSAANARSFPKVRQKRTASAATPSPRRSSPNHGTACRPANSTETTPLVQRRAAA